MYTAFQYPYVILYGGSQDISISSPTTSVMGTNDVWVWDIRNGSWYHPTIQTQSGNTMLPQIYFKATTLPSQGQIIALVSNTTGGSATGVIQKLDINSWSWSFPTTNFQASARTVGYSMLTINNTIYTYGGLSVDQNGYANANAVQNALSMMDANSYQWSSGSNGLGLADHSTCYLKACNCLVTFGGTPTGNPTDVTDAVNLYDLSKRVWNVQGIQTPAGASAPGARRLHTANCLDDLMIVYGGGTNQPADTDVWVLNATSYPTMTWQRITMANQTQGPNSRMGHSAVLDKPNKKIYIFGGWGLSASNDSNMYVLDYVNWGWTRIATTGYPHDALPNINSTTSNDPTGNEQQATNKLSAGAIAGAAVGSALGLILIAAIIAFLFIRKKRRQQQQDKDAMVVIGEEFSDEYKATRAKKDNPFYYNPDGFYNTNDDDDDNDNEHRRPAHHGGYFINNNNNNSRSTHRMSKAWTGTSSPRNSYTRPSEIGDSDRVVTGVLEAITPIDDGTVAATHGSRSPRESLRNSKVLLVTPTEYIKQGQVPNEIISQKPNEFSIPAIRQQNTRQVPVHHHLGLPTPITPDENIVPMSASMEVLRSIGTNASSMMNHTGASQFDNTTSTDDKRKNTSGVIFTHTTVPTPDFEEQEENWTFTDSLSVGQPYSAPPIQYISPNSHQLSTATSAQTWDTKDAPNFQISLVHHHNNQPLQGQYPSSTLNMPMAQTVTPPSTSTNSSQNNSSSTNDMHKSNPQVNIYNTVSPLDALASLGQQPTNSLENTPGSSRHNSSVIVKSMTRENSNHSTDGFIQLAPFISALPHRYQIDKAKPPITGPTNNILFAIAGENELAPVAIKSFGRREAWERECRTLIKLKSPCVVEILEVLTIQGNEQHHVHDDERKDIQYVTVMERLDETLNTWIRHKQHSKNNGRIARDILKCLFWCHNNGIAFCDLKPSNIMHRQGEPWKLIDFEASRTIGEECVGVITPRYCPPEVARATTYGLEGANGVVATASVDLWSLGCVIYELETKKALFPSKIKDETILHFVSHPSPSTPILNNGLRWNESKELEIPQFDKLVPNPHTRQLIKILLSRDPNKRTSASQLLENPYFLS
ncbi:uncharacterized protein B0P05DRAFT_567672 [Gilbertella persicaria]|uniref:uncharacterized protein n=1 Tax=Gilbertella persicaria TaxID=101096 RepID=UPI00221F89B4|nr:uncharacterized protein B0P05DRAFT_567672 [Gilbertella persicaria]KAI8098312.1 hypothetical protein B0P05DRAFT_567672 [Gilbertella persicaria]